MRFAYKIGTVMSFQLGSPGRLPTTPVVKAISLVSCGQTAFFCMAYQLKIISACSEKGAGGLKIN